MAILTEDKIKEILSEYQKIKTYSGTARQCGVSPSTVKKYVELNKPKEEIKKKSKDEIIYFNENIPEASTIIIPSYEKRSDWIKLSKQEINDLNDLRREI